MPRSAATLRAFTSVTPDDRIGLNKPTSTAFTITSFRQIALNVNASVQKGQRVVVTGRLRVRDWESGEKVGTTVDIDVDAIGHDLAWGTASFTRSVASSVTAEAAADPRPEPESGDEEGAAAGAAEEEATREPVATPF